MTFEEINALLSPPGPIQSIMSVEERRYIWDCIRACPNLPVIEIGSAYGGTTALIAHAAEGPVWSIDDWSCGKRDEFEANLRLASVHDRVAIVASKSDRVASMFEDASCGVVLIDGDHTGTAPYTDMVLYSPKVAVGGWLLVDDTDNGHASITEGLHLWRETQREFVLDRVLCMENTDSPKLAGFRRQR